MLFIYKINPLVTWHLSLPGKLALSLQPTQTHVLLPTPGASRKHHCPASREPQNLPVQGQERCLGKELWEEFIVAFLRIKSLSCVRFPSFHSHIFIALLVNLLPHFLCISTPLTVTVSSFWGLFPFLSPQPPSSLSLPSHSSSPRQRRRSGCLPTFRGPWNVFLSFRTRRERESLKKQD